MRLALVLLLVLQMGYSLNRDGLPGVYKTHSAKTMGHGKLGVGFLGSISVDGRVIDFDDPQPDPNGNLASLGAYPFLSLGLSNFLDLAVSLPLYHDDIGTYSGMNQFGAGDVRYNVKIQVPYFYEKHVVDAAFLISGELPTANKGVGGLYREIDYLAEPSSGNDATVFGLRKPSLGGGLALTIDFGQLAESFQLAWHLNIGMRQHFTSGSHDVFYYSTALDYRPADFLTLFTEFRHEALLDSLGTDKEYGSQPTTFAFGTILHTPVGIDIQVGGVYAFNDEYIRTSFNHDGVHNEYKVRVNPPVMAFIGFTWNGWLIAQDDDKDGLINKRDACPNQPEDMDGYKDLDGCPDLDNDEDAIVDRDDACPNQPEDPDQFQDQDGCPDLDNDEDGVPDLKDGCPSVAEDLDGFEDADGCIEADNDRDGVSDSTDKCPMVAEDVDGVEDIDGCPDVDNDSDGIIDSRDKCPNVAEVVNGVEDDDGCPDEVKKVVLPPEIHNVTLKGVNFKTASAELTFESYGALDGIVDQLKAYPEVKIEIHGHTDNVGPDKANQILSEQRAQSVVNYFINKGIETTRMRAIGFGESKPLADNKTADGRSQNRRIEMYRVQ